MVPMYVKTVINVLKENGFEAYVVGGAVRDILRGEIPSDFDIATSAEPSQVQDLFEKTVPTGLKHGTVTVLMDGQNLEVTTFRSENGYSDKRRPDKVLFGVSVETDVLRRDFTMNALCMDENGKVLDLVGGKSDIENKIIKTVGDPSERFSEDALRILRALRFSSVLGFSVEEKTAKAILENRGLLGNISAERIGKELFLLLCGEYAEDVVCKFFSVFEEILPYIRKDRVKGLSQISPVLEYRLIYLLEDMSVKTLKKLKVKNEIIDKVRLLSETEYFGETENEIRTFACLKNMEDADFVLKYYSEKTGKIQIYDLWQKIKDSVIYAEDLAVRGEDIKKAGFEGKEIGTMKSKLLIAVNSGIVANTKTDLYEYMKKTDR